MDATLVESVYRALSESAENSSLDEFVRSMTWLIVTGKVDMDLLRQAICDSRPIEDVTAALDRFE